MKRIRKIAALLLAGSVLLASCGGADTKPADSNEAAATSNENSAASSGVAIEDIALKSPLNTETVSAGKSIYELKCQACHKLTDEKLVGPGWKGITQRRKPGWIVSMITNPEEMLDKDPEAKKLLEEMLVKMPNQNVSKEDALKILEFMRSNDGEK
jgi:mono/diheme cytochrome c family protein